MAGTHSYNTVVVYDAADTFLATVEITGVISLEGPDRQVTRTNTTHLKSTGAVKTSVPGFIDDGTMTLTCDYDETVYNAIETLLLARTSKYFRITFPDSSTLIGLGFFQSLGGPSVPEDDRLTYTVTICPSAGWAFAVV
jgi:hypothetical protein